MDSKKKCVICGSIATFISYKDCCSMACAVEKNTPNQKDLMILHKRNPDKVVEHELQIGTKILTYLTKKPKHELSH